MRIFEPRRTRRARRKKIYKEIQGFTLIEVLLAITLLFMVISAVFYFYSNLMENQGKIKEKYALLRTAREFVDSLVFSGDRGLTLGSGGKRETDRFLLRWKIYPAEKPREVIYSSGMAPTAQLKRVHVQFFRKETKRQVLELHFLVNAIYPPGSRVKD
jgi:prepilin-type N-terminal cleavage/methylation domain-containing protein